MKLTKEECRAKKEKSERIIDIKAIKNTKVLFLAVVLRIASSYCLSYSVDWMGSISSNRKAQSL